MNCPECGAEVLAEAVFCQKCGHRLAEAGGPPATPFAEATAESAPQTARERFTEAVRQRGEEAANVTEEELWSGGYSSKAMVGWWIGAALLSVVLVIGAILIPPGFLIFLAVIPLVWIIPVFLLLYRRMDVDYQLTTQRFIHKHGVLSRSTDRIEVIEIDDVTYRQGLVERFLGVGTIRITSSDRSHPELNLPGIAEVSRVADLIDDTRRKERRRRGLHISSM